MPKKPSFFEKLTGTVNVDDYSTEESVEIESVAPSALNTDADGEWLDDEGSDGQLTVDVYQNPNEIIINQLNLSFECLTLKVKHRSLFCLNQAQRKA